VSSTAALETKARELQPGTLRHNVLTAARKFKATWVELGKLLIEVRDKGLFDEWGYASFEAYCAKELHIRKATALKLTRSFSFLAKHEPKAVANDNLWEKAPAFEVVEVLAGAEERGQLSPAEYDQIRESIWDPAKPTAELRRELGERFPQPAAERGGDVALRRMAAAARRLARELGAHAQVPRPTSDRANALAEELEELADSGT
jgi:hypothetical protein